MCPNFSVWTFNQIPIFLGNSGYGMSNRVSLHNPEFFFLPMHSLGQYFACNWISNFRLDRPCPPLEVVQDVPLVAMQGRLG